jgi:hypothetical protein
MAVQLWLGRPCQEKACHNGFAYASGSLGSRWRPGIGKNSVAKYVAELPAGGDIRRVSLGQLATHTSGLLLPKTIRLRRPGLRIAEIPPHSKCLGAAPIAARQTSALVQTTYRRDGERRRRNRLLIFPPLVGMHRLIVSQKYKLNTFLSTV